MAELSWCDKYAVGVENIDAEHKEMFDAVRELGSAMAQNADAAETGALLEKLVDATGKHFDPNLHEAVSQKETADVPEGQVVQQLRKGYKLRERLLRPASVIIAKHPAA